MKTFLLSLLTSLFFLLPLQAFAQEETAMTDGEAAETTGEDKAQQEKNTKPKRLSGSLPRNRAPQNEAKQMGVMAQGIANDSLVWLDANEETFLSIWQKDRSGYPKGALLILHAEGEHLNWNTTIKPLHDTLPDHGWMTLAISLPKPEQQPIPQRDFPVKALDITTTADDSTGDKSTPEEAADNSIDTAQNSASKKPSSNKTSISADSSAQKNKPPTATIRDNRLESALRFLHDQGQFNVSILGSGSSAVYAQDFIDKITPKIDNPRLKKNLEKPIRAIVLVNGRNALNDRTESFKEWFSDPEIPVLDIFTKTDLRNTKSAALRKTIARQKKVVNYKQVPLTEMNHEKVWQANQISQRVLGFLDTHAAGIEVENATLQRYR